MRLSIATKITLVTVAVLAFFLTLLFFAVTYLLQLHEIADTSERLNLEYGAAIALATRALLLTDPVHDALLPGKRTHASRQFERYQRDIGKQRQALARHRPEIPPEIRKLLKDMNPIIDDMLFIGARLVEEGRPVDDPDIAKLEARFDRKLNQLQTVIDKFEHDRGEHLTGRAHHNPIIHEAQGVSYFALIIAALVAVGMVVGIRRLVTGPLEYLNSEIEQVDAGNYNRRIELHTKDELSTLADSFNRLIDHIQSERLKAAIIQRQLLPEIPTSLSRIQLHADLLQSKEVGGDWYDVQELGGKLHLVVGDASGNGMPAALMSTLVITTMRLSGGTTEDKLRATNELVLRYMGRSHSFATLLMAILDPADGTIDFINCGHQLPLIYRRRDNEWLEEKCAGTLPLGVGRTNFQPQVTSVKLEPGDRMLMFSDGLCDARNRHRQLFGIDAVVASLRVTTGAKVDEQIDGLLDDVREFANSSFTDDIACLLLEYTGEH